MGQRLHLCLALVVASQFCLAGCEPVVYHSQSVLHDDGSFERALLQPREDTPAAALDHRGWTARTNVDGETARRWDDRLLSSLPLLAEDGKRPYFAAWGRFAVGSPGTELEFAL